MFKYKQSSEPSIIEVIGFLCTQLFGFSVAFRMSVQFFAGCGGCKINFHFIFFYNE